MNVDLNNTNEYDKQVIFLDSKNGTYNDNDSFDFYIKFEDPIKNISNVKIIDASLILKSLTTRILNNNDIYYIDVSNTIVVAIPKAFTPNRDNLNDVLKIEYGAGLKTFNFFRIFNRFGKIVFQTNRLTDSWDGKFNGIDQEMDAYTYLIDYVTYKDEHITKTGSFILLR